MHGTHFLIDATIGHRASIKTHVVTWVCAAYFTDTVIETGVPFASWMKSMAMTGATP